ncbi:hypothetical protein OROGR_018112 [Orobanche gracilis]
MSADRATTDALHKKRRTSGLIVDSQKKAAASTSNSGDRASNARNLTYTSDDIRIPLVRESRPEKPQPEKRGNSLLFDDVLVPPTTFSRSKSEEEYDDGEERMEDDDGEERMEEVEDDGEEIEHDVDEGEMEQQTMGSRDRLQPTEAVVNSTPNRNGKVTELVEHCEDAPAPLSVTLTDPDVLDCPICFEPLSPPVYQCARMGIYHAHYAAPIRRTNAQVAAGQSGTTVAGLSRRRR